VGCVGLVQGVGGKPQTRVVRGSTGFVGPIRVHEGRGAADASGEKKYRKPL